MQIRAAARTLKLNGAEAQTPLVVPSFSSRAKPPTPVWEFLQETLPALAGPILVSAYDVTHQPPSSDVEILQEIKKNEPSFVLLDSGGYEALWNTLAVKAGLIRPDSAPEWSLARYHAVLEAWPDNLPLLAVSYDEPGLVLNLEQQVQAALQLAERHPRHSIELLIKGDFDPERLTSVAAALATFPAIGVTEKEIGASMSTRLAFVAALRDGLDEAGVDVPIHVFGGLDPQMTPLYHAAGADIFDGLSWLRFAFEGAIGIYDKSFIAIEHPRAVEDEAIWEMRRRNVRPLIDLQIEMARFRTEQDFSVFGARGLRLRRAWEECWRAEP